MKSPVDERRAKGFAIAAAQRRRAKAAQAPHCLYLHFCPVPINLVENPQAQTSYGKRARFCMAGDRLIGSVFPRKKGKGWVAMHGGYVQDGFASRDHAAIHLAEKAYAPRS